MNVLNADDLARLAHFGGQQEYLHTASGTLDVYRFKALTSAANLQPAILLYPDAGGIRPALFEMAQGFANAGHEVLMPNLYYRLGAYQPFDAATVFSDPPEFERLLGMLATLTEADVMQDTHHYLTLLTGDVASLGYCLGGGLALKAAAYYPERIKAAASVHGGDLATDHPESPHRLLSKVQAKLYLGIAGDDPYFSYAQQTRLEHTLRSARRDYVLSVFASAQHGFAVLDVPPYHAPSDQLHRAQLLDFFKFT